MKDVDLSHFDYWNNIKNMAGYSELDYTDLPRGRILYDESEKLFIVYIRRTLVNDEKILDKLINEFHLQNKKIQLATDHHYDS